MLENVSNKKPNRTQEHKSTLSYTKSKSKAHTYTRFE